MSEAVIKAAIERFRIGIKALEEMEPDPWRDMMLTAMREQVGDLTYAMRYDAPPEPKPPSKNAIDCKRYYDKHREKVLANKRKWYNKNRDRINAKRRGEHAESNQ